MSAHDEKPFRPNWASKPGNTILDSLKERKVGMIAFAQVMGMSVVEVLALVNAETKIDEAIATKLSDFVGASKEFWLEREKQYRESLDYIAHLRELKTLASHDDEATADQLQAQRLSPDPMWQNLMQQL